MCFSASASFTAGAVLTVIGVISIKKSHRSSQILFASIPFIFGVQQLAEGILWCTLPNPKYENAQIVLTYVYLSFAQIIWPTWVPVALLVIEKNANRKKIIRLCVVAGLVVSGYLAYCLLAYPVEGKIIGQHIAYLQDYPVSPQKYITVLYVLATIVPSFISTIKGMWILGSLILTSYIITIIFYDIYFVSVWCFFSSIISIAIYLIMRHLSKDVLREPEIA
jgi:hypothetical protein